MKLLTTFIVLCAIPYLVCSTKCSQKDSNLALAPIVREGCCLASERNVKCGNDDSVLNCICYKNGTCVSDHMSRCYACSFREVKSVRQGCCPKSVAKTPRMDGVCAPEERHQACFAYRPVASCICYMNGTCVNGKADRCNDCSNRDIFSIYEGECKEKTLSGKDGICTPGSRGVRCFANIPVLSCVCYADGTCATEKADKCVSCSNEKIVSVTKGCCPATSIKPTIPAPSTECRSTPLEKCPYIDPMLVKCANIYTKGCICYKDGTCKEDLVNTCLQCMQDDVYAVETDTRCPCPGVQTLLF